MQWTVLVLAFVIYVDALVQPDRPTLYSNINACSWLPCYLFKAVWLKCIFVFLFVLGSILYLRNRWALYGALLLSLCSFLVFSHYESYGIRGEYGLFVLLFLVQAIALYRKKEEHSYREHFQFSLQVIAAAYILAGISKIAESGVDWFNEEAINFVLQSFITSYEQYVSFGNINEFTRAHLVYNWMVENIFVVKLLLFLTIVVEVFSVVLITGKKRAMWYGLLLIGFHVGIFVTFRLVLFTIVVAMIALVYNPVFWIAKGFTKLKQAV